MQNILLKNYLNIIGYNERPDFLDKYLKTQCLVRLKKIGYFCGMEYASKHIYNFDQLISRYDHSLTVSLLTWHFTQDIRATISALFHDIATPCFSHVIDYMNKDYQKQESTEEYIEIILKQDSYLKECLKQDNVLLEDIVDFKKYSIVDNNRPKLCADRLDGVILTGLFWTKSISIEDVEIIINNSDVFINEEGNEEIGFKDREVALLILKTNETIDRYCHSNEDNYMMELLASITKRAIDKGYITYDKLYSLNEEELIHIFKNCECNEIISDLTKFMEIKKEDIPQINLTEVKVRNLNPLVNNERLK